VAAQLARDAVGVEVEDGDGAVEAAGGEEVAMVVEADAGRVAALWRGLESVVKVEGRTEGGFEGFRQLAHE
jgi:hypothetical protein